ncbi:EthD domain-containing protein, partial [Chloroflexota bacterium]
MVKTVAFFRGKTGLSREEFANHYEMVHVPLAMKHLPNMKGYVRNHIPASFEINDLEFDCISEFWYENMDEFQKVIAYLRSDSSQAIHDDEDTFMDRTKSVFFFVDERTSKTKDLANPWEIKINNTAKMMVLAKRKSDI